MTEPTDRASTVDLGRYAIHYQPLFQTLEKMDVQQLIDTVEEPWYNQTLIQVGDVLVRLGVMQGGEFHWPKHDEQDEFFYLLQGEFHIELQDHDTVVLRPHQAFSVPAGMLHRPLVPVRSAVIMIEKAGIAATGD
jgi:mannose-6-phosphate isomerase-like protein (cupin superfamily)